MVKIESREKDEFESSIRNYSLLRSFSLVTTEAEDQVKSRLLLDVVVIQSAAFFELLAGEDEALPVWWNVFLVLDLRALVLERPVSFNVFKGV